MISFTFLDNIFDVSESYGVSAQKSQICSKYSYRDSDHRVSRPVTSDPS
jgi:hypothetical protein